MAKVVWTFQAHEDLDEIWEYHVSASSVTYADFLIDTLLERSLQLEQHPRSGRMVPEINISSIRELIVKNYRIVYALPDITQVHIIAVRHSSMPLGEI